ncbi:tetratricopeptide repeat protein [Pseudoxanthomonas suwonensis]|uniref:tetratricopeptide repeat protein n=1 Tax=Pseudoxanthomonas suwonensis TaxID=314722 RepID=UPI0012DDB107|nr:tetratricopeptide repeat protein [Pseudoxanthomonas suwonensis]
MKPLPRKLLVGALALAALFSGYRIVQHSLADAHALDDPARALQHIRDHPIALFGLADRQRLEGQLDAAAAAANTLVRVAPLEGRAWRVLAQVEVEKGHRDQARPLFIRAVELNPRDVPARAWLADDLLARGEHALALDHIARILGTSASSRKPMLDVLVKLSVDPAFVDALVPVLATHPDWRPYYLRELQRQADPDTTSAVMAALDTGGGLEPTESARWVDTLIRSGHWGKAYAHWAGTLQEGAVFSPVFNGDFEHTPSGTGFDWRTPRIPGLTVTFEPAPSGATGNVAAIEFRGRPTPRGGLEQALLLAPGRYELQVRLRTQGLRTDQGLEWVVACADRRVLGRTDRFKGTSDWVTLTAPVTVPTDCAGQWLRLVNPAPTTRAQWTEGQLWIDHIRMIPASLAHSD